jgi:hypothetical protein
VAAHHGAEFQLDPGAARGAVADGEWTFAVQELDEHVIAHDPLIVLAEMGEEVSGFRVRGLVLEQGVGRFAFHVRLSGEDEHLHRIRRLRRVDGG